MPLCVVAAIIGRDVRLVLELGQIHVLDRIVVEYCAYDRLHHSTNLPHAIPRIRLFIVSDEQRTVETHINPNVATIDLKAECTT